MAKNIAKITVVMSHLRNEVINLCQAPDSRVNLISTHDTF